MPRAKPTGIYKSKLEKKVGVLLGGKWVYESVSLQYVQHRKYTPDFVKEAEDGDIYIEVKGFFRAGDQSKYLSIRDSLEENEELVFIFSSPIKPCRKGTKLTMGGWAEKHGFRYCSVADIASADFT